MSKSNRKPTGEKKSAKKTGETTPSKKRAKKGAQASAAQHEEPTTAPPVRAVVDLSDDEEPSVPTLAAIAAQADRATTREGMLRAAAELALYAGQVSAMLADEDAVEGSTLDMVEALTLATALASKAGAK